ncbi:hypothetical protein PGT21_003302 [Puccinia graminis f. sp. tritici]|uniref:Uncharacterized protein n=1 Tax=Puccinia graminis f. sp. tritici TaxID=56615 RepID=A0A5B0NK62_PUCGR|nr:hypothetical protein PGT21_003302 [Puccinia graminis f. sp. tritici]
MHSVNNEMKYLDEWKQNKTKRFQLSIAYYIMHYTEFVDSPSLQLPLLPNVYFDYCNLSKSGFDTIGNLLKESQNSFQSPKNYPGLRKDKNIFGVIKSFSNFFTDSKIPNFSETEFMHER